MDISGVPVDARVAEAIAYAFEAGQQKERERIIKELEQMEESSHRTRTPIFQEYFFARTKEIILDKEATHLPHTRDPLAV